MQKMFVANATRQHQIFAFRLPESSQNRQHPIPVGTQVPLGELNPLEIEAVVQHHARYGMVDVTEAKRGKAFAPFVYSLDKPVPAEVIAMMVDRNTGVLKDRGKQMREDAAVVLTNQIGAKMRERGFEDALEEVEVELTEDNDGPGRDRRAKTGDDRFEESVVVTREDVQGKQSRGRNRRGRR